MQPQPPNPEELAELLRRASAGDSSALVDLLTRYERRVRLAAHSLLRQPSALALDSQDLVQSVHRAILPGLRQGRYAFDNDEQLIALAVTVLRRKVLKAAQRERKQALPTSTVEQPATQASVEHRLVADETLAKIMLELHPTDRQIVEMRLQGYETTEIATHLECTPAIVRVRLSRLRCQLRKLGLDSEV